MAIARTMIPPTNKNNVLLLVSPPVSSLVAPPVVIGAPLLEVEELPPLVELELVEDDGFKRMRFKKEIIVKAVHQHIDGLSLFQVQYHLYQHDGIKVTRQAVGYWCRKYSVFLKSDKSKH